MSGPNPRIAADASRGTGTASANSGRSGPSWCHALRAPTPPVRMSAPRRGWSVRAFGPGAWDRTVASTYPIPMFLLRRAQRSPRRLPPVRPRPPHRLRLPPVRPLQPPRRLRQPPARPLRRPLPDQGAGRSARGIPMLLGRGVMRITLRVRPVCRGCHRRIPITRVVAIVRGLCLPVRRPQPPRLLPLYR